MKNLIWLITIFLELVPSHMVIGQQKSVGKENSYAIATYECAGIYWKTSEDGSCKIRYREPKNELWKEGLDLVYDSRDSEYRGSIINLSPNTVYEIELSASNSKTNLIITTRNDNFPIGKRTVLPDGESDKAIVITESGTPEAYHLVTVPEMSKSIINLGNASEYGIEINADFVIVRGVEIRNAAIHGIIIRSNRHDIVIEQCHITFWGRIGGTHSYGITEGGSDSGIFAENGTRNITVQRNLIEYPRGASNDWETGHPDGPQGITFNQSNGGNVIRFNNIETTEDHGFNDGIGGYSNFSFVGNMNRDSDIHGNIISGVWDDAIECEGANMNVRIWGNYMNLFFNGIATACTSRGPIYIFRNVLGESRTGHWNSNGGVVIKIGDEVQFKGGRRFIFHNTALQPKGVYSPLGGGRTSNIVTRNNIFDAQGRMPSDAPNETASDYDYDYCPGGLQDGSIQEKHGIKFRTTPSGARLYIPSYNLEFYLRSTINTIKWGAFMYEFGDKQVRITDPVVQMKNPLRDSGTILHGFNDDFKGTAPDLGAFEFGNPPILFGRRAYLNHDEGWTPWDKF
jgi:hypothetical protein